MASRTVSVAANEGLAGPAATALASAARTLGAEVILTLVGGDEDDETDASSALMIMAMGARHGDNVTVTSYDPHAVDYIAGLIESGS